MNEELQKQVASLLEALLASAQSAKAFAADQIPPLVQEIVIAGRMTETAYLLIGLAVCAAGVVTHRAAMVRIRATKGPFAEDSDEISAILGGLAAVAAGVLALVSIRDCAIAWFAPRLYVIEWLRGQL